jgi:signal transduction histidine kinase
MLDRIESSVHQLHTITESLAHDIRSPLTAIRGKLEILLSGDLKVEPSEQIVSVIDELDRLSEFLNTSLDVAEANADALRLSRTNVDLDELVRIMIDLYEPSLSEKGLRVNLRSAGPVTVLADAALLHRVIANLLDNELNHVPASCTVSITLAATEESATLVLEDDGPGFSSEIGLQVFKQRVKGRDSKGHGLGLAFVEAVVRAHGGSVTASNRPEGGAWLSITWPHDIQEKIEASQSLTLINN